MSSEFKEIVGRTIKSVFIHEEYETEMAIHTQEDDLYYIYKVVGDCCSYSMYYDFINVGNLLGQKILKVEPVSLNEAEYREPEWTSDGDYLRKYYGFRFFTLGHCAVLSFRNSSNGYYGGEVEEPIIARSISNAFKPLKTTGNNWMSEG
jgi:hypothetical protein